MLNEKSLQITNTPLAQPEARSPPKYCLLTILLRPHGQLGRGGPLAPPAPITAQYCQNDQSQASIVTVDQSHVSMSAPGLGRHPDVVEGVGIEVLQEVGGGVWVLDGLVVGELLQAQGRGEILPSVVFTCTLH